MSSHIADESYRPHPYDHDGDVAPNTRAILHKQVQKIINLFQARDAQSLVDMMTDEVHYMFLGEEQNGKEAVLSSLQGYLSAFQEIHLSLRRLLIDINQSLCACEFYARLLPDIDDNLNDHHRHYQEKQYAWIIELEPTSQLQPSHEAPRVKQFLLWRDPSWHNLVDTLDTPLPQEIWSPCTQPGPALDHAHTLALIEAKVEAFSKNDLGLWHATIHDEIIMHPPWDVLRGRDACTEGVHTYFQSYKDTNVIRVRTVLDDTQPFFVVRQQIFQTTNKDTGKKGNDKDFVFIEIANARIRYWRTYFDTKNSVQQENKTHRSVSHQSHE